MYLRFSHFVMSFLYHIEYVLLSRIKTLDNNLTLYYKFPFTSTGRPSKYFITVFTKEKSIYYNRYKYEKL
jgi:hypothetical protein